MEWEALLEDACPKCGEMLEFKHEAKLAECSNEDCDFIISDERRRQLVEKMKDERDGDEFYKQGR